MAEKNVHPYFRRWWLCVINMYTHTQYTNLKTKGLDRHLEQYLKHQKFSRWFSLPIAHGKNRIEKEMNSKVSRGIQILSACKRIREAQIESGMVECDENSNTWNAGPWVLRQCGLHSELEARLGCLVRWYLKRKGKRKRKERRKENDREGKGKGEGKGQVRKDM